MIGVAIGLGLSRLAQVALAGYFAPVVPGDQGDAPILRTDPAVLAIAAGIALAIVLAASTLPVLLVARRRLGLVPGRDRVQSGRQRGFATLVVAQIVISTAILCVGGLLARSMAGILATDPGYSLEPHLLTRITLLRGDYSPAQGLAAWERIRSEVLALPGVSAATVTAVPPLAGFSQNDLVSTPEQPEQTIEVDGVTVDAHYADALGLGVVEGRWFEPADGAESRPVAVLSRGLARRLWNGPAVGRVLLTAARREEGVEIVGVVEDTRFLSLSYPPTDLVYYPLSQRYQVAMTLMTRAEVPPETLIPQVRRAIQAADPNAAAVYSIGLVDFLEGSIWEPRMRSEVLGVLALVALCTAMVGLFALMRFRVARSRPEIGLRMALGASRATILRQVVGHGVRLAVIGAAAGVLLALLGSRWVQSLLYGVKASDPLTLAAVAALMVAAAAGACWLPARHASRVDPATTLRDV
jgi:predicted permease